MATVHKNLSDYDKGALPNANGLRIGILVSKWNPQITQGLLNGAKSTLLEAGVLESDIIHWDVPGSYELIYASKKMITTQPNLDAVIAIGSVIQGETKHFDFVCSATAQGIKDVNLAYDVPVVFCVLTDNTLQQAIDRSGGKHGNKGTEAAVAAIEMAFLGK